MANTTYQSVLINTTDLRDKALMRASELFMHMSFRTGGYTMNFVRMDFGETTPNRVTITLSDPLPSPEQEARYGLTRV